MENHLMAKPVLLKKIFLSLLVVLMFILNTNGQTLFAYLVAGVFLIILFLPEKRKEPRAALNSK